MKTAQTDRVGTCGPNATENVRDIALALLPDVTARKPTIAGLADFVTKLGGRQPWMDFGG